MPKSAKYLLIGSVEAFSGKTAIALGLAHQLALSGFQLAYGKPLCLTPSSTGRPTKGEDTEFVCGVLGLGAAHQFPTVLNWTGADFQAHLPQTWPEKPLDQVPFNAEGIDIVLLEGPSDLMEGRLVNLSLGQQAEQLDASVLLVNRCQSFKVIDELLTARKELGDRICGVILNDVPEAFVTTVQETVIPFLKQQQFEVLGYIPEHPLLRSVSVREVAYQLNAEVLCCSDRLELMVEQLAIGAMNVNSALRYFNRASNMAVVTGGDRTDIQLAALESSTNCLILTGHFLPNSIVIQRAEDLEIPVLSVDLDTLTTVEIVDNAFSRARFSEMLKVEYIRELFAQHIDTPQLLDAIALQPPVHR